jgi:transcriptional regulator with XRE-family HTH domain
MARIRRAAPDEVRTLRRALHEDVEAGGLAVSEAIRRMREVMGLSQARFGQAFGLTTRQVWELEAGIANPTLATLARLSKPFGFQVGFVLRSSAQGSDNPNSPAKPGASREPEPWKAPR